MAEDAAALESLGTLLLWAGAFTLATLAYYLAKAIAAPLDVNIPLIGRPFHFIAEAIESGIVGPLDSVRKGAEAGVAKGFNGLLYSLQDVLGLTLLLGLGVQQALAYLWHHALGLLISSVVDPIRNLAQKAEAEVTRLEAHVAAEVRAIDTTIADVAGTLAHDARLYADQVADVAERAAETFAVQAVGRLQAAEEAAIANAVELAEAAKAAGLEAAKNAEIEAERFATQAKVDTLNAIAATAQNLGQLIEQAKAAAAAATAAAVTGLETEIRLTTIDLDNTIAAAAQEAAALAEAAKTAGLAAVAASAQSLAQLIEQAKAAGLDAAAHALTTATAGINAAVTVAEQVAAQARNEAEAFATSAIATAQAADAAALAGVRSIAITAENELDQLVGPEGILGAAALIASIPAIATLTNAIATEAGLGNAACRDKVKGICGTNPAAWEGLLAGLVAIGVGFSLSDLVDAARPLVDELAGVIGEAA